jgi:hypothetical protein
MKYVSFEPAAFLEGVMELSAEERGFYITLIALNYARAKQNGLAQWAVGDVTDELVRKAIGCRSHTWRRIKASLILKGKVSETEGKLRANRVQYEVTRVGFRAQNGQNQRLTRAGIEGNKNKKTSLNGFTEPQGTSFEGRAPLRGMSPDRGDDYRSPPRTKSSNVLQPLPDKPKEPQA